MTPPGRKSKLTYELINKMEELVKHGNYIEVAAAACGITDRSFYHYMKIGRELEATLGFEPTDEDLDDAVAEGALTMHEAMCSRMFRTMKKANAEAEATAVLHVRKHMAENWQAAMTFLERRHPGRWKRREETTVKTPFDPVTGGEGSGIDERAMLNDPEAVALMHEALVAAAREQLPSGEPVVEATVVEDSPAMHMDTRIREEENS